MSYKTIRFERQKLFEQVWEKPMTTLAAEYGLSNVGLRKICKRLIVPLPPQGYHLRTHKGQRPPLPPIRNGETVYTTHIYEPEQMSVYETPQPVEIPEIAFEELPENRIKVAETHSTLHPLIVEAKSQLKKAKQGRYGRLTRFWSESEYISVFPESLDRALRLMNALFKALAKRNYPFSVDEEKHLLVVKILDEQFSLRLEERSRQARHVATAAELKEAKRSYVHIPTYDYVPTGEFTFLVTRYYSSDKVIKDDKRGRLEEKLNGLIIQLIKMALQIKDESIRRQREEQARRDREEKLHEMENMIRKEKKRVEVLREQCDAWYESQRLRDFIQAARDRHPVIEPESRFAKWLVWASLQADRLDPLKAGPLSILDYER
jgi:hypothetical protein